MFVIVSAAVAVAVVVVVVAAAAVVLLRVELTAVFAQAVVQFSSEYY